MAEIRAFRGVRYNPERHGNLGSVIAPPYDVVSPEMQERLQDAHRHNVIRLELPQAEEGRDPYQNAAHLYQEWLTSAVLLREATPALYPYAQTYRLPSGEERTRAGVLALLRLHEYEEGVVLPHEQTLPKAKEDRFRLLSTAHAQFSPIFGVYDPGDTDVRAWLDEMTAGEPAIDLLDTVQASPHAAATTSLLDSGSPDDLVTAQGVRHRLWVAEEGVGTQRLKDLLATLQVFIVDGHHRYETALRLRREQGRGAPWADYVMIYLVALNDTGLVVLPTHRIISGLAGKDWSRVRRLLAEEFDFDTHPIPLTSGPVKIAEAVEAALAPGKLAMLAPPFERLEVLTLRDPTAVDRAVGAGRAEEWRRLDVVALHHLALPKALGIEDTHGETSGVTYTRDAVEAVEAVLDQPDRAAFFVPAPRVEDVREVALAGEKMPEKSTYFWPKAITGLVIFDSHALGTAG
jgi:uncharacterized protein (DUF1015 family)